MNSNDFISADRMVAEICDECGDPSMKDRSRGWYYSMMQSALEELSYDTLFDRHSVKILDIPKNLRLPMPAGMFNVEDMYVYHCSCSSGCECKPAGEHKLWWKREYNNAPAGGSNYTSSRKTGGQYDGIMPKGGSAGTGVMWANIQKGVIQFAPSCSSFNKVKIIYSGIIVEDGAEIRIPRILRAAVRVYVCERFFRNKTNTDPAYRVTWREYKAELDPDNISSEWCKALVRVATMDEFERKTMREYLGRPNI